MKTKEILLLTGILAVCATTAFLVFAGDTGPAPAPPGPAPDLDAPADDVPMPEQRSGPAARSTDAVLAPGRPRTGRDAPDGPLDGPPPAGILDGRVTAATSVVSRFTAYVVRVEEMVDGDDLLPSGRPPFHTQQGFKVDPGVSPQYFAIPQVPYSRHGYRVSVFAAGLNGSSQIVSVTESNWNPQVSLNITPPSPFVVRLVDQRRAPVTEVEVTLMPDPPVGRPRLVGTTDSFGSVVFEETLAGGYDVLVHGQRIESVVVRAPGVVMDLAGSGVQSAILTVPIGEDLKIEVFNAQWGLADVELDLSMIDTTENIRIQAHTDRAGVHVFQALHPGRYSIHFSAPGYQRTTREVRIVEGQEPDPLQVRMARLR